MDKKTEALKLALEFITASNQRSEFWLVPDSNLNKTVTAIREALAEQLEQVTPKCGAIIEVFGCDWRLDYMSLPVGKHKLYTQQYTYTAPQPSKPWVGLKSVDRVEILDRSVGEVAVMLLTEAKLKEKNK